jgi:two-component system OmpR family response regulator
MEIPMMGPIRALVIDDQQDSINALDKLLEYLGCDVTMCQISSESVDHAQRTSPQLILLDIGMPGKSGFDVAKDLRNADLSSFYLVALSDYGGAALRECCNTAGFDQHILKPTCSDQLRELVHSARKLAETLSDEIESTDHLPLASECLPFPWNEL